MEQSQGRRRWWQLGFFLGLGLLLTWLAFMGQDVHAIWERVSAARWEWVVVSLLLSLMGHLSRARRWQLLIESTGHHAGFWACFMTLMTGYLSNLGIPRIGEVGRCASLTRLCDAPILALGGTVVAERVVDLLTFAGLVVVTFFSAGARVLDFWEAELTVPLRGIWGWKLAVAGSVAIICLGLLAWFVLRAQVERPWQARLRRWAQSLWAGLWSAARVRRPWEFFLHTVLIWLSYYAAPLCTLMALGIAQDEVWTVAFYAFVFGSLARTLPLPAGAMGAYHYLITQLLLALGYPYLDGLSLATLNHAVQTLFYLMFGLVGILGFLVLSQRRSLAAKDAGN